MADGQRGEQLHHRLDDVLPPCGLQKRIEAGFVAAGLTVSNGVAINIVLNWLLSAGAVTGDDLHVIGR